jgi:serine/threonine protein kinase
MEIKNYVRICPVCDTENPPDQVSCKTCASPLSGVDFSLSRQRPAPALTDAHAADSFREDPENLTAFAPDLAVSAASAFVRCPDPDCGEMNPPGALRCQYCNTPLPQDILSLSVGHSKMRPISEAPPEIELAPHDLDVSGSGSLGVPSTRVNLPRELARRFRIVRELQAAGSEADLLIAEPIAEGSGGETCVVKLYRRGIHPDKVLLARLTVAGPHVIRLLEYGTSGDGVSWEIMEYCRAGNLRSLFRDGPLSRDILRRIVEELAQALAEIHSRSILHRDLKPENVLIRKRQPLSLVLTDFGIASLAEGTHHFTDGARTAKYASPEALTGVIDPKTDWWAVGMILLEAAAGRHPFDGLSEQVVNHHLATRTINVESVPDPAFRQLCQGLLLRDPALRWGAKEVARWLSGDTTLTVPKDSGTLSKPYAIGQDKARTAEELAVALARNWQEGIRDLKRGLILFWLKQELQDYALVRQLLDIGETRENDDCRLLRFILAAAPGIHPVWQGVPVTLKMLIAYAKRGTRKEAEQERDFLESLYENKALTLFAAHGHAHLGQLDLAWRQGIAPIGKLWDDIRKANRQKPRSKNASHANFDHLVYGQHEDIPLLPPRKEWHPLLLLALTQEKIPEILETEVRKTAKRHAEVVPWFKRLAARLDSRENPLSPAERTTCLLVAYRLREVVHKIAQVERESHRNAMDKRDKGIEILYEEFVQQLAPFARMENDPLAAATRAQVRELLDAFFQRAAQVSRQSDPEQRFELLLAQISNVQDIADKFLVALDQLEIQAEINRFLLPGWHGDSSGYENPVLFYGILAVVCALLLYFFPWGLIAVGGLGTWRYLKHHRAETSARLCFNLLCRQVKRFILADEAAGIRKTEAEGVMKGG